MNPATLASIYSDTLATLNAVSLQVSSVERAKSPEAIAAFESAKDAQDHFWKAVRALELALGCEIDSTFDLSDLSLAELSRGPRI